MIEPIFCYFHQTDLVWLASSEFSCASVIRPNNFATEDGSLLGDRPIGAGSRKKNWNTIPSCFGPWSTFSILYFYSYAILKILYIYTILQMIFFLKKSSICGSHVRFQRCRIYECFNIWPFSSSALEMVVDQFDELWVPIECGCAMVCHDEQVPSGSLLAIDIIFFDRNSI